MMRVVEQIQRLQGNELTVFDTGESGTGKELVARAIHVGSLRTPQCSYPFNCTTTTRELADSQLFGHRRGSFTGAVNDQLGLVSTAAGGTLFLDEIGDLPPGRATKLLLSRAGRDHAARRNAPAACRRAGHRGDQRRSRTARGRRKIPRDLYYRLTVIRMVDSALARSARRDSAP